MAATNYDKPLLVKSNEEATNGENEKVAPAATIMDSTRRAPEAFAAAAACSARSNGGNGGDAWLVCRAK